MLEVGLSLNITKKVEDNETANVLGSGGLKVFATPALITLMENAAFNCVEKEMSAGETTVGISLNMKHLKASAVGDNIECKATLKNVNDRKLTFEIVAESNNKIVGTCTHERFIVNIDKFMGRL